MWQGFLALLKSLPKILDMISAAWAGLMAMLRRQEKKKLTKRVKKATKNAKSTKKTRRLERHFGARGGKSRSK